MRDLFIDTEFNHLGIDHEKSYLVRRSPVEDAQDDSVDTDGFTGSRCACDQKMRHAGNVGNNSLAADILTDRKGKFSFKTPEFPGFQQFTQMDRCLTLVGNFNADR